MIAVELERVFDLRRRRRRSGCVGSENEKGCRSGKEEDIENENEMKIIHGSSSSNAGLFVSVILSLLV